MVVQIVVVKEHSFSIGFKIKVRRFRAMPSMLMFYAIVSAAIVQTCLAMQALTDAEIATLEANGIEVTINSNETLTVAHHGLPDHGFAGGWGDNPNQASYQNYSFNIPRNATVAATKGCVELGAVGLSLSGAAFYNPYTGFGYNAVEGECQETFDDCSGHPSPDGAYHYHKLPACIYTGVDLRNKLLGVALDGYPIYGPMDETGKNWTSLELDSCHGHMHNGRYMYRITTDFPYTIGCYHGETYVVPTTGGGGGFGPPGQGPPPPGRRRRSAGEDLGTQPVPRRYRRQIIQTDPCNQGQVQNWQQETCYAWCQNPSTGDFDNCPYGPDDNGESNSAASITGTYSGVIAASVVSFIHVLTITMRTNMF